MYLRLLYVLLVSSLFNATSNNLLSNKKRHRYQTRSLREIIAGINYAHHDTEEKVLAYKQLQRRNLAPKVRPIGSLSEYETLKRWFDAVDNSWSHSDQNRWPELYPACEGFNQSPIDLKIPNVPMPPLPPIVWRNYDIAHPNLRVDISRHSVDATADWSPAPTMSGGILTGEYRLASVHWHWAMNNTGGSEHTISESRYVLEMHAVHYDVRYKSIDEAMNTKYREAIAIVAILFQLAPTTNLGISNIVYAIRNSITPFHTLRLSDFKMTNSTKYYTFVGSLTTPPCSQIVRWIVLEMPEPVSESEVNIFRQITYNGSLIGSNYRHLQRTNYRDIYYDSF